ncbi:MAG: DUF1830 domain-containing protein [Cyanothece sp. SIO1E1]|nr:DUF1830 domain-containing protein [Cyanothece sp. SIO1E1]
MTQILDALPSSCSERILCCYINRTSSIQIVRIANIPNWYFERVVFSGQRLLFETLPQAQLEVHMGHVTSAILVDTISCDRLRIEEQFEETLTQTAENNFKVDKLSV